MVGYKQTRGLLHLHRTEREAMGSLGSLCACVECICVRVVCVRCEWHPWA